MMDQFKFSEDTRPDEDAFQRLGYAMVPKQYIEAAGKPLKVRVKWYYIYCGVSTQNAMKNETSKAHSATTQTWTACNESSC
jgi:hypothetical protein